MDQEIRNKLRNVVTQCRKLLEDDTRNALEGKFAIFAKKDQVTADPNAKMAHLSDEEQAARKDILDHFGHIKARGFKPKDALDQLIREIAFTHLNRLCAYKMMEAREVYVGGQKFREAVSRGVNSNGVKFYLAEHPEEERLFNTGHQDVAYRHFLDWLGGRLSDEIGVLFNPNDPANRLYPRQKTLDEVLELLNGGGIKAEETELRDQWPQIWSQDETIGWVYQYFTPKELRDQARKESQAPRNSYELAFRNQFFTPRYVVEFLTDNTLGRIWYEMRMGRTTLKEKCRYLVRRPDEVFLAPSTCEGHDNFQADCGAIAKLLMEGNEEEFPSFSAADDAEIQRMISLSHCVSAYMSRGDDCWEWLQRLAPVVTRGEFADLKTQEILDYLFLTCRNDRHGGDGAVYKERWFVAACNEVRRRALEARKEDLSQQQLLKCPVFVPYRRKKDPRELRILDPACGSGHFLLYCFDLLLTIYEEAYTDPDLGPALQEDYASVDDLRREIPRSILARNLHGIDIDLRASQIAALALWLRCQRAYQDTGLKKDRPQITRSNFVCAEPMPGEEQMLKEFVGQLEPKVLGQVVEVVFDKMKLAGEAGSLLKIEEEIRDAIHEAKRQYAMGGISIQRTLFDKPTEPVVKVFSVKDITDAQFFEGAEAQVIEALRSYAEKAQNGQRLQRRLFSDDAVRGFAFVDLCQKRYDVVLMNPPFGSPSPEAKKYATIAFKNSKDDIDAAFVDRGRSLLTHSGLLGVIANRTELFKPTLRDWRDSSFYSESSVDVLADLGFGVLDSALVEAVAYVLRLGRSSQQPSWCARLLRHEEKASPLLEHVTLSRTLTEAGNDVFVVPPSALQRLPESRLSYWATADVRSAFANMQCLDPAFASVHKGTSTTDDFRFLRLAWEIPADKIALTRADSHNHPWSFLQKGGEYSPYFADIHMLIRWHRDGGDLHDFLSVKLPYLNGNTTWVLHPESNHFKPGITYSVRTASGFSPRVLPEGCVFSHAGNSIFPASADKVLPVLGVLMSRSVAYLLELLVAAGDAAVSGSAARSYEVGVLRSLPFPNSDDSTRTLAQAVKDIWLAQCDADSESETSRYYCLPAILRVHAKSHVKSLGHGTQNALKKREQQILKALDASLIAERDARSLYGFSNDTAKLVAEEFGVHPCERPAKDTIDESRFAEMYSAKIDDVIDEEVAESGGSRTVTKKYYFVDRRLELIAHSLDVHPRCLADVRQRLGIFPPDRLKDDVVGVVMYAVGCLFGRWDIRYALGLHEPLIPELPISPLPRLPCGALAEHGECAAKQTPKDYPLTIDWDGVLADDPSRADDIKLRVRGVFELLWDDCVDSIEKEASGVLGVTELREYFRKPGKGGFWDDHISRYSKSRRKAPIYWLLQSSKKNYAIWLYYHRLDKDLPFKALVNYVEPKIRLETSRLESLRSQKAAAGESGKEAKRLAKDVERQEDFLSELRDFEDKLRRAANLHLEPDLNDGVVLNIAPLHELVPWKEAKKYWDELMEGKYEWSSIGKQLRQKGLVK